jgi:hypothetical protein
MKTIAVFSCLLFLSLMVSARSPVSAGPEKRVYHRHPHFSHYHHHSYHHAHHRFHHPPHHHHHAHGAHGHHGRKAKAV